MVISASSWLTEYPPTVLIVAPYTDLVDFSNLILGIGTGVCALFVLIVVISGLIRRIWRKDAHRAIRTPEQLKGILRNLGITLPDGGEPAADEDDEVNPPGFE